jgi:hypothetical protein
MPDRLWVSSLVSRSAAALGNSRCSCRRDGRCCGWALLLSSQFLQPRLWGFRQWFLFSPASPPSWRSHSALRQLGQGACSTSQAAPRSACGSARFLAAREIEAAAQRYDCNAMQLYASALLLGQGVASALREVDVCSPNDLHERIIDASERCKSLVGPEGSEAVPPAKDRTLNRRNGRRMNVVEKAIAGFDSASTVPESEVSQGMSAGPQRP